MRTARRLVNDELGITLPLAMIMIVLIGVMGAGLISFVNRDLNTVIEENRGQRAFELADAGVGAAKRQISSDCGSDPAICIDHYNDPDATGDDLQWSAAKGGLILNDLDGVGGTPDSVNVKISSFGTDSFKAISTGTYGVANRKIEAIFKLEEVNAGGGGDGIGHPLYYTPSDIKIEKQVFMNSMSFFTEQDIILQDDAYNGATNGWEDDRRVFIDDMRNRNDGTIHMSGTVDELCNWDTTTFYIAEKDNTTECWKDVQGTWNTEGRLLNALSGQCINPSNGRPRDCYPNLATAIAGGDTKMEEGGLAAEGLICGVPTTAFTTTNSCDPATSDSVADGVYAYDCTTGPVQLSTCQSSAPSRGNNLTFVDKEQMAEEGLLAVNGDEDPNLATNPEGTISYPFPRPRPNPENLLEIAAESTHCPTAGTVANKTNCFYAGAPPDQATWQTFWPSTAEDLEKLVFIDAQNNPVNFSISSPANKYKGVLVVWCGQLVQQQSFNGIILSLYGDGFTYQSPDGSTTIQTSSCGPDMGLYTNDGYVNGDTNNPVECKCWVYAQGGNNEREGILTGRAGIVLEQGSKTFYPTNRSWNFLNNAFDTESPPTTPVLQSWRELYE